MLHATPFGRSIYAMGASAEAAQFAGIRVKRIKTILYMVSGLVCALAGVLWTFRLNTAVQNNGLGLELSTSSRSCCSPGCRSSAARAR